MQSGEPGTRLRAIVVAYACEPGAGSESGAGWALIEAALEHADCLVITEPRHERALRAWIADHPDSGLTVEVVPAAFGGRWVARHRIGEFLAYLAWLRRAGRRAAELAAGEAFDVAWHATYSVYWLPTPVVRLGLPCVWGPVGGAVTAPPSLRPLLGIAGRLSERLDATAVRLMAALPATRRTWRAASVRVFQNEATATRVAGSARAPALLNHSLLVRPGTVHRAGGGRPVVWAGALERRKGPALAVHALAAAGPSVRLRMYGDGPERGNVAALAERLGVTDRLEMMGRVPRRELLEALAGGAAALFTGLYEEGGLALGEALAIGVPAVVLDHGGAGTIARRASDPSRVVLVPPAGVRATAHRLGDAITAMVASPPAGSGPLFDRTSAVAELAGYLREAARG